MDSFHVDTYVEPHEEPLQYGFDGKDDDRPLPPMEPADGAQAPEVYGYDGFPNADYALEGGGDQPAAAPDDNEGIFSSSNDGPVLPEPSQMQESSSAFREWRRQNAIYLEEKEKKEKEMRAQILSEAEEYKKQFYEKTSQNCEATKALNREREKLNLANQEKFHKEADQQYWKAIAELIPREVSKIEKRGKKLEEGKKASIEVIQGPKPGKPTDMSRMRQILSKMKQTPPAHMLPPKKEPEKNNAKNGDSASAAPKTDSNQGKDGQKTTAPTAAPPSSGDKAVMPPSDEAAAQPDGSSVVDGEPHVNVGKESSSNALA